MKIPEKKPTFWRETVNTVKLVFTPKMLLMDAQLLYSGTSIAFWSGMLTPIMILQLKDRNDLTAAEKESKALYGMVCFGFGEVIGGIAMGQVIDRCGSKMGSIKNVIIALAMCATTYASLYQLEYNYMSFIMCFVWGYLDGAVNIHTFQILGFEFADKSGPFAVFNLIQGIWVFCMQELQGFIDETDPEQLKYYTLATGAFGVIASGVTYFFPFAENQNVK